MKPDKIAARSEVPAKFNQIPVKPSGHNRIIKITGKTNAVDTEMMEAGSGFQLPAYNFASQRKTIS